MMMASASGRSVRQAELIGLFRPDPAELDRSHETHHLAVDDLEAARLHEVDHRLVHGLAPRRADGDLPGAEPRESIDKGGRRGGRGFARGILHALDQLAVVALALGERRSGRREHDDIDLGIGELAAFRFELQHAAHLLFRRDVAVRDASGVQRNGRRQRRRELRLLGRVGRGRQQTEAMGLLDVGHRLTAILRGRPP